MALALCVVAANGQGTPQEMLQVKFDGVCRGTNDAGDYIRELVNNKSLLRDYAEQNGITNRRSIDLVYLPKGDERGDVIAVVDANTGAVLFHEFALFFSKDLPTADGSQISKFAYIFNHQTSDSIGSAMLRELLLDRRGNAIHIITGNLQFFLPPDGTNGLRLCTATVTTGKPFEPKNPPTNSTPTSVSSGQ